MMNLRMTCTLAAAALCATISAVGAAPEAVEAQVAAAHPIKVHVHTTHKAASSGARAKTLDHWSRLKSSPWDDQPTVKADKCTDLCFLHGFYSHQQGRNCVTRPSDLCMQYKLGLVALEAVLVTAECPSCDEAAIEEAAAAEGSSTSGKNASIAV